jgi:hypothetical protein
VVRSLSLFVAWTVVGFAAGFATIYGFTPIGWPAVGLVLAAWLWMPRISGSRRPEAYGALAGFGFFWLWVATTVDADPSTLAAVGGAAVALAGVSYVVEGRRRCSRASAVR